MGRNKHLQLDRLIDDVARGRRELSSIRDASQREAVRIALRLHKESAQEPDAYTRIRMRAKVMGTLSPRRASLRDNAWTALELLARPAPYIVRAIALASVLVVGGMGAVVASADTLPDDLLYPVKIGAESVRLALADSPDDRAVIELSIAEHRLREAERLAASGRAWDALVASAMYSQNVASAAADLAPDAPSALAQQLEVRFDNDRSRASSLADSLSTDTKSAAAARVIALIAQPASAPSDTGMTRVATMAADVAQQLVQVAEQSASEAEAAEVTLAASETSTDRPVPAAATAPATHSAETAKPQKTASSDATSDAHASAPAATRPEATRKSDATRRPTAAPTTATEHPDAQKANEVLRTVRRALEETRAAADRARTHTK